MSSLNKDQKALLDSIPVRKHDPAGVTVKMLMERLGCGHAAALEVMNQRIQSGDAVSCDYKEGSRWVRAIKLK